MKTTLAALLIFLLTAHIASHTLITYVYKSNKAYFAANFCKNKNKPELKCDGKCYLNKLLAATSKSDTPAEAQYDIALSYSYLFWHVVYALKCAVSNSLVAIFKTDFLITHSWHSLPFVPPEV